MAARIASIAGTPSWFTQTSSSFQVLPLWNFIGMPRVGADQQHHAGLAQLLELALERRPALRRLLEVGDALGMRERLLDVGDDRPASGLRARRRRR